MRVVAPVAAATAALAVSLIVTAVSSGVAASDAKGSTAKLTPAPPAVSTVAAPVGDAIGWMTIGTVPAGLRLASVDADGSALPTGPKSFVASYQALGAYTNDLEVPAMMVRVTAMNAVEAAVVMERLRESAQASYVDVAGVKTLTFAAGESWTSRMQHRDGTLIEVAGTALSVNDLDAVLTSVVR